jgi:hypothetical protein
MEDKLNLPELNPNLFSYLEEIKFNNPVKLTNQEELLFKLKAHIDLPMNLIVFIIEEFLNEAKSALIIGDSIDMRPIGMLYTDKDSEISRLVKLKRHKNLKRRIIYGKKHKYEHFRSSK